MFLLASGTSLIQYILSEGPWSIFFIVPEVDLKTASVTNYSSLSGSWGCYLSEYESNVENPDD